MDETPSDYLELLADGRRRRVIHTLREDPGDVMSLDELVDALRADGGVTGDQADRTELATDLHHRHLPKLADGDAVDYDPGTRTVRYEPVEPLESLLEAIPENPSRASH